jgi:hypothetical protein
MNRSESNHSCPVALMLQCALKTELTHFGAVIKKEKGDRITATKA